MSATRRGILGVAVAAPLLAQFTGTAAAADADSKWGSISDGWVEVRWTEQAQALLDQYGAVVTAVAPARSVSDDRGPALRFPVRTGQGDPSLNDLPMAQGDGALDGGITVSTPNGEFRVRQLGSTLADGTASGSCEINGVEVGHRAVFRLGLDDGRLTAGGASAAAQPLPVRVDDVPLRATPQMWEVVAASLGEPSFDVDTVLAYVAAEGMYHPPQLSS